MNRARSCSPSSAADRPGQTTACRARSGRGTAHQQPGHDTSDPASTGTGNGGMRRLSRGRHTHLTNRRPVMAAPIEAKVQAAGVAGAAAGVVLWVLQTYAFKGNSVPPGLVSLVDVAVPGILALAGGYLAPHTDRPLPVPVIAMPPVAPEKTLTPPGAGM